MSNLELSIIVTNYKNPDLLKICLNSIKENVRDVNYEIIVVDSDTGEDTELMMREDFPNVNFFPFFKNIGFQQLVKKGLKKSMADYILILNGDILVKKKSVEKLFDYLKNHQSVGMIGPKLFSFNEKFQASCFRFYKPITIIYRRTFLGKLWFAKKHLDWFLMKDYDHKKIRKVDWLMGSAFMVSRKAVKKVGYMDIRFFMYMEDVDWCRRFWESGLTVVYYPEAQMLHYHGKGSGNKNFLHSIFLNKLTWIHITSALKYFKKYFGKPNPRLNGRI